jgi:hypothetical protein
MGSMTNAFEGGKKLKAKADVEVEAKLQFSYANLLSPSTGTLSIIQSGKVIVN